VSDNFQFTIIPEPRKPHWKITARGDETGTHRRNAEAMIGWRFYQQTQKYWNADLESRYQAWRAAEIKYWQNFLLVPDHNPVSLKEFFRGTWIKDAGQRTDYAEFGLMVGDLRDMTRTELGIDDIVKQLEAEVQEKTNEQRN
jgi:hypothetical protein